MSLWADPGNPAAAFGLLRKGPGHLEAVQRLKDWTRSRFRLGEDDTIVVVEAAASLPGLPPLETVIAFWTGGDKRHHFKVFKPVANVVEEDLPPAWLKDSLAVPEGVECECC